MALTPRKMGEPCPKDCPTTGTKWCREVSSAIYTSTCSRRLSPNRNNPSDQGKRFHTAEVVGSSPAAPTLFVLVRGSRVADTLVMVLRRARTCANEIVFSRTVDGLSPSCATSAVARVPSANVSSAVVQPLLGARQQVPVAVEREADRRVASDDADNHQLASTSPILRSATVSGSDT